MLTLFDGEKDNDGCLALQLSNVGTLLLIELAALYTDSLFVHREFEPVLVDFPSWQRVSRDI